MEFREITERYRLEKILKSGRSGTVLRATDTASARTVVVKLIAVGSAPGLEQRVAAFGRMAGALAALPHPAVPALLDSGVTPDGSAFLVLEHLDGRGLDTLAGAPPTRVLPLLIQVAAGLEALAGQGIPDLNLTPDNVLVVPGPGGGPEGEQAKLLGLGTALFRPSGDAGSDDARRFRAPELVAPLPGERADARADLYSLALTACQVLGATIAGGAPEPAVQMPLALSFELENAEALRQILERCMRRRATERPSHQAVRYAFQLALAGSEPSIWQPAAGQVPAAELFAAPVAALLPPTAIAPPVAPAITPPVEPPAAVLATSPPPATALPPEPEIPPEGDVLPTISDEMLDAMLAAQPSPAPTAPSGQKSQKKPAASSGRVLPFLGRSRAKQPAPPPAAPADGSVGEPVPAVPASRRRPLLLVAAAVLLLAAVVVFWFMLREPLQVSAPAPTRAAAPQRPPQRPAAERLEEARLLVAQGDDDPARQILRSFSAGDEAALPPASCLVLQSLRQTLALAARDRLPEDLAAGLESGNLARLRSAVETVTDQPALAAELPATAQADLDRARRLVALYSEAEAAAHGGRHAVVLERFAAMLGLSPRLVDPQELRKKSAEALETEAEKLVEAGRYPEALAGLEPLRLSWPDRLGLAARIGSYETYQKEEPAQKAILDALPGIERRRKPYDGLEALAPVKPTPHLAPRFAQARGRLENLLAQLDQQPPQVVLRDGYYLTYSRGTVVTLSFRATDDYEVRSVKLMVRPPGGKMRSMPLEKVGQGYNVEIPPGLHQNGTVNLYVVATDLSGHEGFLGTPEKPLQLTRQQGFERIVR